MRFFVGIHHPSDAQHFQTCCISANVLSKRKRDFAVNDWIMDSGAFSMISRFGKFTRSVEEYSAMIRRWRSCGNLLAAVTQDYMCEPHIVAKTGLSIIEHQGLTVERYDALLRCETGVYVMPVLQGYYPSDYVRHLATYGDRLTNGAWVGVGSVCKRNSSPGAVEDILHDIKRVRPDLKLHGFGLKKTALQNDGVRGMLESSDSMAWSFAARMEGRRDAYPEAEKFRHFIDTIKPSTQARLRWL